jgi:hypothetical protein
VIPQKTSRWWSLRTARYAPKMEVGSAWWHRCGQLAWQCGGRRWAASSSMAGCTTEAGEFALGDGPGLADWVTMMGCTVLRRKTGRPGRFGG